MFYLFNFVKGRGQKERKRLFIKYPTTTALMNYIHVHPNSKQTFIYSTNPTLNHLLVKEEHIGYEHLMLRCMTYENEH